jgi:7-alpha-hydroxysteroid dehydrogenase
VDGRVAIVTGARRGIGAASAIALAEAGADVIVAARTPGSFTRLLRR